MTSLQPISNSPDGIRHPSLSLLTLETDSGGSFAEEFRVQVERALAGAGDDAEVLRAASPDHGRLRDYAFAARRGHMSLGRTGLEATTTESVFGLYAHAYHRQFSVASVEAPGCPAVNAVWRDGLARIERGPRAGTFEEILATAELFDNIFFFRLIENLPDDNSFLEAVKLRLAPLGMVVFTAAYSPAAATTFGEVGLFRVYDRAGLEQRLALAGLRILHFETHALEATAKDLDTSGSNLAYIAAQKP